MARIYVTILCSALLGVPFSSHAQVDYMTVGLTGDAAPGLSGESSFTYFELPVINASGQVATFAHANGQGIWVNTNGHWSLVTMRGQDAPDTGGAEHWFFGYPLFDDLGNVVFHSGLTGAGVNADNDGSFWIGGQSGQELVARQGDVAPGIASAVFDGLGEFTINNGHAVGYLSIDGPGIDTDDDSALYTYHAGALQLLAREGNEAPGTNGAAYAGGLGRSGINASGIVFFYSGLVGAGVNETNSKAIWLGTPGSVELYVRSGEIAPGTDGMAFSDFTFPFTSTTLLLNDLGQTAFFASLTGPAVDTTNNIGLWAGRNNDIELVARTAMAAPGVSGAVFQELVNHSQLLNGSGQVTFMAVLDGPEIDGTNNSGIWTERGGVLELLVRTGDVAQGTNDGMFGTFKRFSLASNAVGQVAFEGTLVGANVSTANDRGIWLSDTEGDVHLIVREGDSFDTDDDVLMESLRTVERVTLSGFPNAGGEDGHRSTINDSGELVFHLSFTDGSSGVFISSILDLLPGDITGDGYVGIADLDIVLANWGDAVGVRAASSGDLSGDGIVGQADLDLVLAHWGDGTPPDINIPEPGSLALCGVGLLALGRRRRHAA